MLFGPLFICLLLYVVYIIVLAYFILMVVSSIEEFPLLLALLQLRCACLVVCCEFSVI